MSNIIIKLEDISKQYRLGQVGSGTLKSDLQSWWAKMRGKEDPTLKIGIENRLDTIDGEYVWALKDINLDVVQGEVLGIIGKNGAGKSTLLKLLSRITTPTTGKIKVKGRIASLLEVGTGFHGELTGRENIFLNGAILGMKKKEIECKFDEIVDFSGVDKYIDTPVKRYSSGMYVRLAFAVAAHLEPEILIVDEVLAVGDAEFQKKAIGKMQDISKGGGRTVLFVSHNMIAVNSLCSKVALMERGTLLEIGDTQLIVKDYVQKSIEFSTITSINYEQYQDDYCRLIHVQMINAHGQGILMANINEKIGVEYQYEIIQNDIRPLPNLHLYTIDGTHILFSSEKEGKLQAEKGIFKAVMWIPQKFLNTGKYYFDLSLTSLIPYKIHFHANKILYIELIEDVTERDLEYSGHLPGVIRPEFEWQITKIV